jgi:alcohol dehydrogenase/propanol-preferring alcohol dehydrogenase
MHAWAVVENGQPLQEVRLPLPVPVGTEVLLEVTHCGVCHSDVHLWDGFYSLGGEEKLSLKDRGVTLPLTMGHEIVGRIVGQGSEAGAPAGELRIVYPWLGCGTCEQCLSGHDNMCTIARSIGVFQNGGYATHVVVPHPRYLVDPRNLDPAVAATYACSGVTAYGAIKKVLPLPPTDPIVIVGAGGLGLNAIAILRALGHLRITVVDTKAENREAALLAGATAVIDGSAGETARQIVDVCGGPVGAVVDFVNSSSTAQFGFAALRKGGTLVQVGFFGGSLVLPLPLMALRSLTVRGSYVGSVSDLQHLVGLAAAGKLLPLPVTTVDRASVNDVLAGLRDGKVTGRVVLASGA